MIYLTIGNKFNGIYKSQVIGVCRYLNEIAEGEPVVCVSFIPVRNFFAERGRIKTYEDSIIVLPVFYKSHLLYPLVPILAIICLLTGQRAVMGRGTAATRVGLLAKKLGAVKTVIYDGRGAHVAEMKEYGSANPEAVAEGELLESAAVLDTDFRLAVSNELVVYWRREFGYAEDNHGVIPCTVDGAMPSRSAADRERMRATHQLPQDALIFVYAGASQTYQSFDLLEAFLAPVFEARPDAFLLLLSNISADELSLARKYPNRVKISWLAPTDVGGVLAACDYGLLLRAPSVTNQVAAPTKFAEYLAAGLPVIISEGIGDYSRQVREHGVGYVIGNIAPVPETYTPSSVPERDRIRRLAEQLFMKEAFRTAYKRLLTNAR